MEPTSRHTQFGTVMVFILGVGIVASVVINETAARHAVTLILELVLLACLAMFYALTVEVDDRQILVRFGIGLIKKRFLLREIRTAMPVRNRWYWGWGIRRLREGWLYNVSGLDAVEIELESGRKHRIGTDRPDDLARAIRSGITGTT